MGGADKGLQDFRGAPLAQHALARLTAQTRSVMISANRNLASYAAFGVPVLADTQADFAGPLAGLLTGLLACPTPWLAMVPCDAPWLPPDLVQCLADRADAASALAAVASTRGNDGVPRLQPVFCLVNVALAPALRAWLAAGGRKAGEWFAEQSAANVVFDGPNASQAFMNINTLAELAQATKA